MKKLQSGLLILIMLLVMVKIQGQVSDRDGNRYKTITTGNQVWMAENLNVSHYRNGDLIPQVQDSAKWAGLKTGAWCYYEWKKGDHKVKGKIYNGYAVTDKRGLLPEGFEIPINWSDWNAVETWMHEGRPEYLSEDTSKIRMFLGPDLFTQDCRKNKSYYRTGSGSFGSLPSIGFWWLPGDSDDMTYYISRCTGHDGAYFGYAPHKDRLNYGFFVRGYSKKK